MNKTRRETAVPTTGHEADVRAANAGPWQPLPGMVKQQCPMCRYFFATTTGSNELRCPDCLEKAPRARARLTAR